MDNYERVYDAFYRVERCGVIGLSDGGGPFGFDISVALLFDDLVTQQDPELIVECGSFLGDTTVYLGRRYSSKRVLSCDIDPDHVRVAQRRTTGLGNVQIDCQRSVALVRSVVSSEREALYFLDAHWGQDWPLVDELRMIRRGIAVIHDFDIGHARFGFDRYGDVACDAALLREALGPDVRYYLLNPEAELPFPCLQTSRRAGVAVVPFGADAEAACAAVAHTGRAPVVLADQGR